MKIDKKEYQPLIIKKVIINGEEQQRATISVEQTKDIENMHVTLYTKKAEENNPKLKKKNKKWKRFL